jgi:hypothetical protein
MTTVSIKYAPGFMLLASEGAIESVRADLARGKYQTVSHSFDVKGEGEDAAEEVFDLTNNPYRQFEREEVYGRGRSLSTGDIVVVGDEQWVCMSFGWAKI